MPKSLNIFEALTFKPNNRALMASLLVMVILACHGAYGVNHQYVCEVLAPQHSGESAFPGSQALASSGEQQEPGVEHLSFLMALFSALVAAFYSRMRRVPSLYASLKLAFKQNLPSVGRHPPHLSSPPVLQVFRL